MKIKLSQFKQSRKYFIGPFFGDISLNGDFSHTSHLAGCLHFVLYTFGSCIFLFFPSCCVVFFIRLRRLSHRYRFSSVTTSRIVATALRVVKSRWPFRQPPGLAQVSPGNLTEVQIEIYGESVEIYARKSFFFCTPLHDVISRVLFCVQCTCLYVICKDCIASARARFETSAVELYSRIAAFEIGLFF